MKRKLKVKNAKKVNYNGIEFQSQLELYCYKKLEELNIPVEYEQTTFTICDSFIYPEICHEGSYTKLAKKTSKIRAITYTPDFIDPNGKWIIETKGYSNESFPLRWKLFKKHLTENTHTYVLFMPRNKKQVDEVIELIKQL
jgi:hypothetical protein